MSRKELFSTDKFSALLFDCDGTIAHSMPVHLIAWNQALAVHGATLSEADHERWAGRPTRSIVELLNQEYGFKMPPDEVMENKEKIYVSLITSVQAVREVQETIEAYYRRLPLAVVSGSPRESVLKTLTHLGLGKYFDCILGNEDYQHGKPAPDCFLNAAAKLNVAPERCLVFEDGELGIQAAIAAKMRWVRVIPASGGFDLNASDFR
ncbi:MAG: HAD family hydrolase [Bdellovibrionales bacterium]